MAFYPDVQPGDKFQPDVLLANDVRHLFNRIDGFRSGIRGRVQPNYTTIKVYCEEPLRAKDVVNLKNDGEIIKGAIPCELYCDHAKPWGIITVPPMQQNGFGECIIGGAFNGINGYNPIYLRPGIWREGWSKAPANGALNLHVGRYSSSAVKINSEPSEKPYNGLFKVEVKENGENNFSAKVVMGGTAKRDYCGIIIFNYKIYTVPVTEISITDNAFWLVMLIDPSSDYKSIKVQIKAYSRYDSWYGWRSYCLCGFYWREIKSEDKIIKKVCVTQNANAKWYAPLVFNAVKVDW